MKPENLKKLRELKPIVYEVSVGISKLEVIIEGLKKVTSNLQKEVALLVEDEMNNKGVL